MTDLDVRKLQVEGFAIAPGVLNSSEIGAIARALDRVNPNPTHGQRRLLEKLPELREICARPRLRNLLEPTLGATAKPVRGLFFDKTPHANWGVAPHQDATIAVRQRIETPGFHPWSRKDGLHHVRPPVAILEQMLAVRLHLDPATRENGCLWVVPHSHHQGLLTAAQLQALKGQAIPLPVPAGGAIMMRPLLVHASYKATTPTRRRVIHLEFAAAALPNGLQWAVEGGNGGNERIGAGIADFPRRDRLR